MEGTKSGFGAAAVYDEQGEPDTRGTRREPEPTLLERTIPRVTPARVIEQPELAAERELGLEFKRVTDEIADKLADLMSGVSDSNDRIGALEQIVDQQRGQIAQLETNEKQIVEHFGQRLLQAESRLTAMAQQIARNTRLAVLQAVFGARGSGDTMATLHKACADALNFVEPPAPEAAPGPGPGDTVQ